MASLVKKVIRNPTALLRGAALNGFSAVTRSRWCPGPMSLRGGDLRWLRLYAAWLDSSTRGSALLASFGIIKA
uniref:Uncharacterized protein n=1 Tax=Leersia perrieri TaxID=77586 RepID=A0A0D9VYA1_9ORYZ